MPTGVGRPLCLPGRRFGDVSVACVCSTLYQWRKIMNSGLFKSPRRTSVLLIALTIVVALVSIAIPSVRRLIANPSAQAAAVDVDQVLVRGDSFQGHVFDPPVIQVVAGTTITWTFADRGADGSGELAPHNVVGTGFVSPVIEAGTWSHTFATPGSYAYVCTLHGNMDGRVEVVAP